MDNFQDRYIRNNQRRDAKMNPILWDDNTSRYLTYHGKNNQVECFENFSLNGKISANSTKTTQIKCKNGKAEVLVNNDGDISRKMYDIDLDTLASNRVKGIIEDIDRIHNGNVVNQMSYDRMMLENFSQTMGRLGKQINNSVLSLSNRSIENDPFFFPNNK